MFFGLGKPFAILQISRLVLFAIILSMIVGEGAKIKQLWTYYETKSMIDVDLSLHAMLKSVSLKIRDVQIHCNHIVMFNPIIITLFCQHD